MFSEHQNHDRKVILSDQLFFLTQPAPFSRTVKKRPRKRELSKHSLVKRVKKKFKVLTALRCSQFERISKIVLTVVTYLHKIEC